MISFALADFAAAAKVVRNIPAASSGIAILDHARMIADGESMALTMSSLDIEATVTFPCRTESPVEAAIPRAVLDFFIAHAGTGGPDGSLEFDADALNVTVRHDKARMTLPCLPVTEFPVFGGSPEWSFTLRANELTSLLRTCEKAMDETRPMIMGVFFHFTEDELRAVAANGYRVHRLGVELPPVSGPIEPQGDSGKRGITIPDKTVRDLIRIFEDDESEITVSGSRSMLSVSGSSIRVNSKLIAEPFPDYERIMPEAGASRMSVDAASLEQAIARLMIMPRKDGKGRAETTRAIRLSPEGAMLKLEIRGNGAADAEDFIACEIEGDPQPVSLQAKFIRDAIAAAGEKRVTFADTQNATAVRMLTGNDRHGFIIMQITF